MCDDKKDCEAAFAHHLFSKINSIDVPDNAAQKHKDKRLAINRYKHVAIERKNGRVYWKEQADLEYGQRHIVFVEMKITRISEINTSDETFRCVFHMFFTWLARFDLFFFCVWFNTDLFLFCLLLFVLHFGVIKNVKVNVFKNAGW